MAAENFQCAHSKLVSIADLKPHPKNPNKHPKDQIERLAKIIAHQGQRAPIVVSKLSGFIVKGHGRFEALKKLGWKKAAIDFQTYPNTDDEYADLVADNAIASWANLDLPEIGKEFAEFEGFEFDEEIFGLEKELPKLKQVMFGTEGKGLEKKSKAEKVECLPGETWDLDGNRLQCSPDNAPEATWIVNYWQAHTGKTAQRLDQNPKSKTKKAETNTPKVILRKRR